MQLDLMNWIMLSDEWHVRMEIARWIFIVMNGKFHMRWKLWNAILMCEIVYWMHYDCIMCDLHRSTAQLGAIFNAEMKICWLDLKLDELDISCALKPRKLFYCFCAGLFRECWMLRNNSICWLDHFVCEESNEMKFATDLTHYNYVKCAWRRIIARLRAYFMEIVSEEPDLWGHW